VRDAKGNSRKTFKADPEKAQQLQDDIDLQSYSEDVAPFEVPNLKLPPVPERPELEIPEGLAEQINEVYKSPVKFDAATRAFEERKIGQEGYEAVKSGNITLDEAVRRVKDGEEKPAPKPPRKATANPDKRRSEPAKKGKGKSAGKEPRPAGEYEVVALAADGETVEEVIHESITRKALLELTGEKKTAAAFRSIASEKGKRVRATHRGTGTVYRSRPTVASK
jgi:hypothetical protein